MVPIGPQRLGLFGRLYRALRNTKYGRLLLELTLGCLVWAGLQHPGPLRGPPTAGPTLAMTNLPYLKLLGTRYRPIRLFRLLYYALPLSVLYVLVRYHLHRNNSYTLW